MGLSTRTIDSSPRRRQESDYSDRPHSPKTAGHSFTPFDGCSTEPSFLRRDTGFLPEKGAESRPGSGHPDHGISRRGRLALRGPIGIIPALSTSIQRRPPLFLHLYTGNGQLESPSDQRLVLSEGFFRIIPMDPKSRTFSRCGV